MFGKNKKLKILFLITDLKKGGAERVLINICSELKKNKNIDFLIATLFSENEFKNETRSFKIVNLNYELNSLFKKKEHESYKKVLNDFRPDIIHTNRFLAEFLSSFYVNKKTRYICHLHSNTIQFRNFSIKFLISKSSFLSFIEKRKIISRKYRKTTTHFICVSKNTLDFLVKNLPKSLNYKTTLLGNSFNYKNFYNKSIQSIENQQINIINIGNFHSLNKNQNFLIEIALELKKIISNFKFTLLGDGKYRKIVEQRTKKEGISKHFNFLGNVDDVKKHLSENHIYLHVAKHESFGLVLLEAMASGLAVVTLDGGGNKDLIKHEHNGYILKEQDAKLFSNYILKLSIDNILYTKLTSCGQETAKHYDNKHYIKKLTEIYFDN